MKHKQRPDYITWNEFNRLLKVRGQVPKPEDDSEGDTAVDELAEVVLGKDYPEEQTEDADLPLADLTPAIEDEQGSEADVNERYGVRSSEKPDPAKDLDSESSTR